MANYGFITAEGGWTVETWFRSTTSSATAYRPLFFQAIQSSVQRGGTAIVESGRQIWFGIGPSPVNGLHFSLSKEDGTALVSIIDSSGGTYGNDSTWHHVAVRLNATKNTWDVFLDGLVLFSGTTTGSALWDVTSGVMTIGADAAIHRGFYSTLTDVQMAYFTVYNKAITNNRIAEHYTAGNGGTVYYGDTEVERIGRLLDWADVPLQSRNIDPPVTVLQGIEVADANALDKLHETADSGLGLVFADGQSRIVYQNRAHRYNRFTSATLGESLQSAPDTEIQFSTDNSYVFNDIRGTRPFGGTVRIQEPLSKAKYGRKVYAFTLQITDATELRNAVTWFLGRYGAARPRISGVTFSAVGSTLAQFIGSGGVEVGDAITITDLDAGFAPDATMSFIVEQIGIDADFVNQDWKVKFALSPYELYRVFQIGVSALGDGSLIAF